MNKPIASYTCTVPPSVNGAYRSVHRGRIIKSKIARQWLSEAIQTLLRQKSHVTITQDVFLHIVIYPKTKAQQDIDNRNKGIMDALQESGIIADDSQIRKLLVEFGGGDHKNLIKMDIYDLPPNQIKQKKHRTYPV
ncbi:MAG: RusA family crossover junction endodeoxyribonuclease [Proteobacteria bacterium]|nr:RusA family crossover junction endodeoxyribonuclease [Pseudomonadota bacterium]NBP17007.1 RusA family crossover junction endodeoxyribonuclease [bacterium]